MAPKRWRHSKKCNDFSSLGVNIKAKQNSGTRRKTIPEPEGPYTDKPLAY